MWQDWTNAILGIVVLIISFLSLAGTLAWTFGILGALIAIVGFWGAGAYGTSSAQGAAKTV